MNSTAAGGLGGGGVVSQDEKHFYDKTIRPECNFIAGELNRQLFAPMGLRFEFLLDGLDVFQEDEAQRAAAFKVYVDAGLPLEVVGLDAGLGATRGLDVGAHRQREGERQAAIAEQMKPAQMPPPAPATPQDERESRARGRYSATQTQPIHGEGDARRPAQMARQVEEARHAGGL